MGNVILLQELRATSVARDWESVIIEVSKEGGDLTALDGFFLGVKRVSDAIVSDSASMNVRVRLILSLRHPKVIFLPCFAHLAALDCADLLRFAKVATVASNALHVVNVFNASSNKWLQKLQEAMRKVNAKKRSTRLRVVM